MKKIYMILKKIIISAFALYGYNLISPIIIPINTITISILTVFGIPSLMMLILIFYIAF